jgi:hypothetical protein
MLDTSTKHYGSVSFHNGVVNIGPYFALWEIMSIETPLPYN